MNDLIDSYIERFSETTALLYLAVDGEEIVNANPEEGSRACECGFPILNGLRPGPTPPPEIVTIALEPEGDEYTTTADLQRYTPYVATFSDKDSQDGDAKESMLMTSFIIGLLIVGMIAFNNDARVISDTITIPLERISEEMNNVARMRLEVKTRMKPSNVFEIRNMQRALLHMKKGIMSFSKFIPKDVVANMLASGQEASLGVGSRQITTFFSDIANFTTICETMNPEELLNLLTEYFDSMSPLVINSGGSVLDYIGDAVLACWNAPQDVPLHGYACTLQALEMHKVLEVMRVRWKKKGYPPVHIRCGIHTGYAFVGNIGGTRRMKYSVLGDGVAMSERCEDGNKKYGSRVMITEPTYREPKVASSFLTRKIDFIEVKDFDGACAIYQVVCLRKYATEEQVKTCATHNRAMEHYRKQEFKRALELFEEVLTYPVPKYVEENYDGEDLAATIMIDRCKRLIACPPPPGAFDLAALGAI